MINISPSDLAFAAVLGMIGIGLYGLLVLHHLIKLIVALQLLVKGAILALIMAGKLSGQLMLGESLGITVIVVDTIVAVVVLALAVRVNRHFGTLDVRQLSTLRG